MYAAESLVNQRSIRTQVLETSADAGWTSVLVARHRSEPERSSFETSPTPDVTLVVALEGKPRRVASFDRGRWREAVYLPGCAGLTAPGAVDRLRWSGDGFLEVGYLYIPHRTFAEAADALSRVGTRCPPELSALMFEDAAIAATVRALLAGARAGAADLYAEQAAHWLATHLLVTHGAADAHHIATGPTRLGNVRLARTLAFIRAHYGEAISLETLAAQAGISKFHFARKFRECTGMSPHAYVVDTRMSVARRLLRSSDLSIAEIARAVGYVRSVQFAVAFRSLYDTTPTAFRAGRDRR